MNQLDFKKVNENYQLLSESTYNCIKNIFTHEE